MQHLLKPAIEITKLAGQAVMEFYQSSFGVTEKSPDNPVTDADIASDTLLKEKLSALFPEAGWLSEETADNPARLEKEYLWVVDPIDGTKEFVMGLPEFSISVGLVQNGQPVLGIIYNPATEELYSAVKGEGAQLNGESITVTGKASLDGAVIDASRSERRRGEFAPFEDLLEIRTMGSIAYKLARVAAGQCDATWSRGPKHEWDVCAGTLIVQEAGGICGELDNTSYEFNKAFSKVRGVIANNTLLHEPILEALAPYGAARKD